MRGSVTIGLKSKCDGPNGGQVNGSSHHCHRKNSSYSTRNSVGFAGGKHMQHAGREMRQFEIREEAISLRQEAKKERKGKSCKQGSFAAVRDHQHVTSANFLDFLSSPPFVCIWYWSI